MAGSRSVILLLSAFVALCTGCRCTRTCVELPFPGLKTELNQASTNHGTLRLLIVHGMSNHTQGYSSNFVDTIAQKLKLGRTGTEIETLTNAIGVTNGFLTTFDLARNETNKLRAYELTWSPATYAEKASRFEFDSRLNGQRASLNRQAKSTLLNDGFADAILYLNEQYKPRIQDPVTNALMTILGHDFRTNDLFVIVTHSLGSKITFDSLNLVIERLASSDNRQTEALTNLAAGLSYVIMLANQVPLLRLGETNAVLDQEAAPKTYALQKFLDTRRQALDRRQPGRPAMELPKLKIIAVTDPNDLLSYPLRRSDLITDPSEDIQFGNLFIRNTPAFLRWAANPVTAHEGYFDNPKLVNLLIAGYNKPGRICLKDVPPERH